jgi:hypothetical protein
MLAADRIPRLLALLFAGLAFAAGVRYNGFAALYTDVSGYVSAGERWRSGEIQKPVAFQFQPVWPNHETMGSPLAYRPGAIKGTDVVEYPLGIPVFIAAATSVAGELGAHLVSPLSAALLAWCLFGLGRALAGPWAGAMAALLISASPVTVRHTMYVSSDVPCTAFWALAWLMSLSPGAGAAAAAGSAVAAAVMIRPNTAALALVVGLVVLVGGAAGRIEPRAWQWRRAAVFAVISAIGPALVLWSNALFFGGPFEAGYKGAEEFFKWEHVAPNLRLYPSWLVEVHSGWAFAGLAAIPMAMAKGARTVDGRRSIVVAISALGIVLINLAVIVPYLVFNQWSYLRFVLPAIAALFLLFSAALVWFAREAGRIWRPLAVAALVPPALVITTGVPEVRAAVATQQTTRAVLLMGHYLREALPRDAVVLSFMHSGAAAHYARRPIVRLDIVQPDLDTVITNLEAHGYHPLLLLDEVIESPHMARIFPHSSFNRLDWPPRATFMSFGRIWLMDPADRRAHQAGRTYPSDALR